LAKSARLYDYNSRSLQEVGVINNQKEEAIAKWLKKIKGTDDYLTTVSALKELIVAVSKEEEELDIIVAVGKRGNLGLELNDVAKQTRWLKAQNISFVGSLDSSKPTTLR
jgi:hypothetical protein